MSKAIELADYLRDKYCSTSNVKYSHAEQELRRLDAENAELRAQQAPAVPEGYQLVPINPTPTMQGCGVNSARSYNDGGGEDEFECVITIYKAMLAAAKDGAA